MPQTLPCLHPNPGWSSAAGAAPAATPLVPVCEPPPLCDTAAVDDPAPLGDAIGKHCILELYDCDPGRLDNQALLRDTITAAASEAGATLLNLITHRFQPQGVTGLALLAESHISIHTWPESGYAAVDVFTCGDHTMPERACAVLAARLGAGRQSLTSFRRETPAALASAERLPEDQPPPRLSALAA